MRDTIAATGSLGKGVAVLDYLAAAGPSALPRVASGTAMPKSTAHRVLSALVAHGLVEREAGAYRLGSRLVELGRLASQRLPSLAEAATPALLWLRDETGESTQLYVAEGGRRICIVSIESPHSLRTIVAVGAVLPMELGSAGRALSGERHSGEPAGWTESVEEREAGVASVSAPVYSPFHAGGSIVAAVSVSGPVERTTREPGERYGPLVEAAARRVTESLGAPAVPPSSPSSSPPSSPPASSPEQARTSTGKKSSGLATTAS
jgi:DNA-binding IclR family transcriptional regulator